MSAAHRAYTNESKGIHVLVRHDREGGGLLFRHIGRHPAKGAREAYPQTLKKVGKRAAALMEQRG